MVLKAVIFDFDGVIYPSPHFVYLARKKFFKQYNVLFTKDEFKKYLASGTPTFIEDMNKKYKLNVNLEEMRSFTRPEYKKLIKNRYVPNPKIKELLLDLKKNKIKFGIASSNRGDVISYDLSKLGLRKYFEKIIAYEDVINHKPAPDVYLKLIKELHVSSKDCVGIEDGLEGIIGMKKAGIKTIGIVTEFTTLTDFQKAKADLIIKSTRNLNINIIKNLIDNNLVTEKKKLTKKNK